MALTGAPLFLTESSSLPDVPRANFSVADQQACEGIAVQLQNTSLHADTWLWEFPGGTPATSTQANPTVTYSTAGAYEVRLTASSALGSHTMTQRDFFTVDAAPVAAFDFTINGTAVTFENLSENVGEYYWLFDTGLDPNYAFNPTYFYGVGGVYEVSLVVSNDCGTDTLTQQVVLTNLPISSFGTSVQNNCDNFVVVFNNTSGNSPTNYIWTFEGGDPATSTAFGPEVSYAAPGTYEVVMISENSFGFDTLTTSITLTGATSSDFDGPVCTGGSIVVNGTVYDEGNPTGTEVLAGANQYGCDSTINVQLAFIASYEITLVDTIAAGEGYPVGNSVYTETGQYVDTLVASTGCDSLIYLDLTVLTTGTEQLPDGLTRLAVSPNPATGMAYLELDLAQAATVRYTVLDIHGRAAVASTEPTRLAVGLQRLPVPVSKLASGIYLVRVRVNDAVVARRLVVE